MLAKIEALESGRGHRSSVRGSYVERNITEGEVLGVKVQSGNVVRHRAGRDEDGQMVRTTQTFYRFRTRGSGGARFKGSVSSDPARDNWYNKRDANGHPQGSSAYTRAKKKDRDRDRD